MKPPRDQYPDAWEVPDNELQASSRRLRMGFAHPKGRSSRFQDYARWPLWLQNVLASGELQLRVWPWSAGGPGGGMRLVRQRSWRLGVFGVVVGSWMPGAISRPGAVSWSGGPGSREQSVNVRAPDAGSVWLGWGILEMGLSQFGQGSYRAWLLSHNETCRYCNSELPGSSRQLVLPWLLAVSFHIDIYNSSIHNN